MPSNFTIADSIEIYSIQPVIYILKLNTSKNPLKPALSYYAQGISPRLIFLDKAYAWDIIRYTMHEGVTTMKSMNPALIEFQRLFRRFIPQRRLARSLRFLRHRELFGPRPSGSRPSGTRPSGSRPSGTRS